jgi:hypothetical protein
MNDRIKQLAEQTEKYADDNFRGEPTWSEAFESKFAELMTAEFIGLLEYEIAMLEKYKTTSCNDSDRRWHEGKIVHFRRMIGKTKDHFGDE